MVYYNEQTQVVPRARYRRDPAVGSFQWSCMPCHVLSSRVWLFATQWTVAYQAPRSPWDSSGKNTGMGCQCGQFLSLPAVMCDNGFGILPTTEAHQALVSRVFMGSQWSRRGRPHQWLRLVPCPSRGQADTMWPKDHLPHCIHDVVSTDCVTCFKVLIQTERPISVVRPYTYLLGAGSKDQTHQHSEFTQTHVHQVGDAIQPSHPLSPPSPPAPNPSHHQGLFQWVNSSHEVAKVLEFQLQHQSFQWTPRTDLLQDGLVGSPCSPRDSQESSLRLILYDIGTFKIHLKYKPLRS